MRLSVRFGGLTLLEFSSNDTDDLFDVRNHPTVREFMPDTAPLNFPSHVNWLGQHVKQGGNLKLFIVRLAGEAIGFTLARRLPDDTVELGVIFKDADQHAGLPAQAAAIMLYLSCEHMNAPAVITYVNVKHLRALTFNRGFGLIQTASSKPNELCFKTPRATVLGNDRYKKIMSRVGRTLHLEYVDWP